MPCNLAVSIAKAGVTTPQLLALLTPDIVQQVTLTYLQQQYPALHPRARRISGKHIYLNVGPGLVVITDGSVEVTDRYGDTTFAETLANEIEQLLLQLADSLFQQKLQQILGSAVTQVQTVNVNNDGALQQAAVFTLEL
ncbi:MAG: hypothetical protein NVS2B12_31140 [Ktedonobacteraceae bacterium]